MELAGEFSIKFTLEGEFTVSGSIELEIKAGNNRHGIIFVGVECTFSLKNGIQLKEYNLLSLFFLLFFIYFYLIVLLTGLRAGVYSHLPAS